MNPHLNLNLNLTLNLTLYCLLIVLLTVFAVAPLTYPGFWEVHSGFLPAFNAAHLSDAPNWGRVADPVRGEGKLPYLLTWPFWELSGSGVIAVKWGYGLAFLLGALGVYAWTRRRLGDKGGVLAAVVYTYLPWHLSTVYVRGAYAEAWLWALWPFILWAVDRLAERRFLPAVVAGLPALVAAFWTQPGLATLSIPVLAVYGAVMPTRRPWLIRRSVGALALSLLLLWSAACFVPKARVPFADHFLYPYQLFSAAWDRTPSFQLGLAAVGLTIVTMALLARGGFPIRRTLWFWLAVLLLLTLLTLPPLAFLWRVTGFEALLTYPWQLLALTGLPLAFLAGSVVRSDERLVELPAWAGLLALVVLASYPYLAPRFTQVDPGPEPVALFQPVEADAPQIILLDYEVRPPTESQRHSYGITPTLTLTMTWQAVEPVADDYTIFVHVLAQDNKVAQRDTRPCDGECPTNTWQPGEIVVDRHQLTLPPDAAADGPYRLAVGLYLLDTGERAAVVGRDNKAVYLHVP